MRDLLGGDVHPAWAWVVVMAIGAVAGPCVVVAARAALAIWGGAR